MFRNMLYFWNIGWYYISLIQKCYIFSWIKYFLISEEESVRTVITTRSYGLAFRPDHDGIKCSGLSFPTRNNCKTEGNLWSICFHTLVVSTTFNYFLQGEVLTLCKHHRDVAEIYSQAILWECYSKCAIYCSFSLLVWVYLSILYLFYLLYWLLSYASLVYYFRD